MDGKEIGKNNSIDSTMRYDLLRVKNILWKLIGKIIERRLAGEKGELFENFQRETNKNNGCIFYPIS